MSSKEKWNYILENTNHKIIPLGPYENAELTKTVLEHNIKYFWCLLYNINKVDDINIPFRVYLATILSDYKDPIAEQKRNRESVIPRVKSRRNIKEMKNIINATNREKIGTYDYDKPAFSGHIIAEKWKNGDTADKLSLLFEDERGFCFWGKLEYFGVVFEDHSKYRKLRAKKFTIIGKYVEIFSKEYTDIELIEMK